MSVRRIYKVGNSIVVCIPLDILAGAGGKLGDYIRWQVIGRGQLVGQVVTADQVRKVRNSTMELPGGVAGS